jgi:alkaline phosphatase
MSSKRRRIEVLGSGLLAGVIATGVTFVASPTSGASASGSNQQKPKNVIFINGDGMSAAHREAARLYLQGFDGQLAMDRLPVSGQLTTDPRDPNATVTDSAAAATAWATGQKTYNGAISVDVDKNPLPILGEQAKAAGKSTGLVTTAQVTDASPAAFFSHTPDRGLQDEIARQYLEESKPDVILGGGEDWWYPATNPGKLADHPADDPTEASKGTKGNLVAEAKNLGYSYASNASQLANAKGKKLLGLFSNEELFQQKPEGQGDVYSPPVSLATMTSKALSTLEQNKKGFFLFVEEEAVDEFAHNNNGTRVLQAMGELEKAVAVVRQFQSQHPDTLVVVTGDHDCGGLTVEDNVTGDESTDGVTPSGEDGPFTVKGSDKKFLMDWTTTGHTGVDVPVTASGPGSEAFSGKHPNTLVYSVLRDGLGVPKNLKRT